MSDAPKNEGASGPNSAATSLRDTAKWMIGGIAATAAGVFAGSSLTNFGKLSWDQTQVRLCFAIAGLAVGFLALALLMQKALGVLTVESVSLGELSRLQASADAKDKRYKELAQQLFDSYGRFANVVNKTSLATIIAGFDALTDAGERARAARFNEVVMADATFLWVRERFREMVGILPLTALAAAIGFGTFAWAANPPDPVPAPEKGIVLKITR